ncbi:MAG: hypothetical protein GIX03_03340 [Candidatus Eremiobacteraeota bacterium]|nr:hypothetical protein [Candidatus Eremiobacteraeota bacterium]MBC5802048.1 hypothetical protein [Candidatus Eremiobacteraeota bacterium]MBC5823181.1 hypothetical protein [Candidatus Eremiobacteraeota bacterium]
MTDGPDAFTAEQRRILLAHYERVAPLLVRSFGGTPCVAMFIPDWSTKVPVFEETLRHAPPSIPTVRVGLRAGPATFAAVAENAVLWQAHRGAIGFMSWAPTRDDPARASFGRILLEPSGSATIGMVKEGALAVRALLASYGLDAIVLLGGLVGLALWVPFSDAPEYEPLRLRLDALAEEAARAHPALLTTMHPLAERGDRVHIATSSNAVGRFSALPYSLRALDALPVVAPIAWDELDALDPGAVTAVELPQRLAARGDVLATQVAALGGQAAAPFIASAPPEHRGRRSFFSLALDGGEPRGRIIRAAIVILDDGRPRDADALCAEAIARGLVPATTTRKDVYTELIEYISRAKGHERTPRIVQDPDRRFRRNLPADDWPAPKAPLPVRAAAPSADTLAAQLRATGAGDDPSAYEQAVCDAFAALGFLAQHLGGPAAPDGYLDAPLGEAGYRVMLECKRAGGIVQDPDAAEAAKHVGPYHAQFATLIGPAFGDDIQLAGELQTHGVAAFTSDDLIALLAAGADPREMRPLFAPGFAAERIEAFLWEREHGERKRIAVICQIVTEAVWRDQVAAARTGDPADAPRLDEDAAMMLVDEELLGKEGSQQPCTRADVRAAFLHLTDPLMGAAVWLDDARDAIVVTHGTG